METTMHAKQAKETAINSEINKLYLQIKNAALKMLKKL